MVEYNFLIGCTYVPVNQLRNNTSKKTLFRNISLKSNDNAVLEK